MTKREEQAYVVRSVTVVSMAGGEEFPESPGEQLPEALAAFRQAVIDHPDSQSQLNMTVSPMLGPPGQPHLHQPSAEKYRICISNDGTDFYVTVPV